MGARIETVNAQLTIYEHIPGVNRNGGSSGSGEMGYDLITESQGDKGNSSVTVR